MGRVWPRHGHHGRPLNSVVRFHLNVATQSLWVSRVFLVATVLFVLYLLFSYVDRVGAPVSETSGTVLGVVHVPADGPPKKAVSVRLADKRVVTVIASRDEQFVAGQPVRVSIYRRLISGIEEHGIIQDRARK